MVLAIYSGPRIDVGPTINSNILKSNGEVVHWSTYQDFLPEEMESTEQKAAQ